VHTIPSQRVHITLGLTLDERADRLFPKIIHRVTVQGHTVLPVILLFTIVPCMNNVDNFTLIYEAENVSKTQAK